MKTRRELKNEAKAVLKDRWGSMIALHTVPIVSAIFGAGYSMVDSINQSKITVEVDDATVLSSIPWGAILVSIAIAIIISIVITIVTSGVSWTVLDLIRGDRSEIEPLQDNLRAFKMGAAGIVILIAILTNIFVGLWYLLLVIPGVIKIYAYSQSYLTYYDAKTRGEDLTALQAITASRNVMKGHKFDLFVLGVSFIGWYLLAGMTFGIGLIWLIPYVNTTKAAFYNEISKEKALL